MCELELRGQRNCWGSGIEEGSKGEKNEDDESAELRDMRERSIDRSIRGDCILNDFLFHVGPQIPFILQISVDLTMLLHFFALKPKLRLLNKHFKNESRSLHTF